MLRSNRGTETLEAISCPGLVSGMECTGVAGKDLKLS